MRPLRALLCNLSYTVEDEFDLSHDGKRHSQNDQYDDFDELFWDESIESTDRHRHSKGDPSRRRGKQRNRKGKKRALQSMMETDEFRW